TTPYTVRGWLKDLCDDALAGRRSDVAVVRFRSIDNPAFPKDEFDRARREMPAWRFSLFYEGEFSRPAGAVYDSFENRRNVVVPFDVPAHWPRHIGVDFGETNTAAVFLAEDPNTLDLYAYGSYHAGGRSVEEHVRAVRNKALPEGGDFDLCVGGSWSEAEWRKDYIAAGLPVARPPVREVEVGIQRVYRQIKTGRLKFFDSCARLLAEVESYSREVDDRGEPLDTIRDKAKFHRLDALRYIVATLRASAEFELVSHSRLGSQARIL
ncbi:MAG TPA: hypothetical protein VNI20_09760, partial [Fimbriimonadaceae bacterium]|nr:hypothetical protein [Fimbriimonadaceae bacterium]